MFHRIAATAAVLMALAIATVAPASALERKPYDAAALAADQKAGKSILVHVTAPWCSTCKAQKTALDSASKDPAYDDVVLYDLDFDTGGDALKALDARSQSTLIAYKGETETGRSVGDASADSIGSLIKTAL
jgi:thioredoxin 1